MRNPHTAPRLPFSALSFALAAAFVLGALYWHPGDQALLTMDAPAYQEARIHTALAQGNPDVWYVEPWLGTRYGTVSPDLNLLVLRLLRFPWSGTLLFAMNLFLAGGGMYVLLRSLRLAPVACALGGMAFMLTNNVITLTYAGHVNKLMTYAWIPWSMAFFLRGLRGEGFRHYVVSGAFFGLAMLSLEVQVCYFLGLWYAAWLALTLWKQRRDGEFKLPVAVRHAAGLAAVAACALVLGFCATHHHWKYLNVNTPVVGAQDTTQNWLFATQYFFPPEELLSFFTTVQLFGAPAAYWGRCGSPSPLRLSDDYLGLLPAGLAILGGIACWRLWQARLFIFMALGSLLASFGREGGLFLLLYQLPTMKSQRNPHRWTYFVALAACVLAAYGANWLWERLRSGHPQNGEPEAGRAPAWEKWKRGLLVVAAAGVALFAAAGFMGMNPAGAARGFYGEMAMASPQAPLLAERARCLLFALMRTGFFLALSCMAAWWVVASGSGAPRKGGPPGSPLRAALPWIAVLAVLACDLGMNAKRYLVPFAWRQVLEENPLANFLRQDKDLFRVKVIGTQQVPVLNNLVSNVLPYHGIPVVDPPAASRIPNDYSRLLKRFEQHYVRSDRYFDFFNVKYVLSPVPFNDPSTPFAPIAQWGGVTVYRRENGLPRAWLAPSARVVKEGDEEVLAATLHPLADLRQTVVLEDAPSAVPVAAGIGIVPTQGQEEAKKAGGKPGADSARAAPPTSKTQAGKAEAPGTVGVVRVMRYEGNRVEIEAEAAQPSILVLGDKWDPDWKAWVDGRPSKLLKANFLMRGVELGAGRHRVRMEYRPTVAPFAFSAACVLAFAGYGLWLGLRALRRG